MKKPYAGIGLTDLLANKSISTIASFTKMMCVILCLQFVCMSAKAASLTKTEQTSTSVTFEYSLNSSSFASIRVIKSEDISKYYGKAENCPAVYTTSCSGYPFGSVTIYTSSFAAGSYIVAIIQNNSTVVMNGFSITSSVSSNTGSGSDSYKNPSSLSVRQNNNSFVASYELPTRLSSPYIRVIKVSDISKYQHPDKCPTYRQYNVSSGTTSMTQSIANWDYDYYVFLLYNNKEILKSYSCMIHPFEYEITSAKVDYAKKTLNVDYIVASTATIQIAGTSISKSTPTSGKGSLSLDISSLANGSYTVQINGAQTSNCKATFDYYVTKLSAVYDNVNDKATIYYEIGGDSPNATLKIFTMAEHYKNGDKGTPVLTRTLSQRKGSFTISTANFAIDRHVVRLFASDKTETVYIDVVRPTGTVTIANRPSSKKADISYSPNSSGTYVKVVRKSDNTLMGTYTSSPFTVDYSSWQGGDYYVTLYKSNGQILDNKTLSVHKITGISKSKPYVRVGYSMGSSSRGGYTVMRIANASTGTVFNEVPVNYDQNHPTGTIDIPVDGAPSFSSGICVVYFVVDGVVYDSAKIWY